MTTKLLRLAAVLTVAVGASACSSVPDWVDPTTWLGDSAPPPSQADSGQTPDLADIPNKPAPESTPDDQKQVSDSLAADRSQTNYSGDALRGGTEQAAPPPEAVDQAAANAAVQQSETQSAAQTPAPQDTPQQSPPPDQSAPTASPAPSAGDSTQTPPPNQNSDATPPTDQTAQAAVPAAQPAAPPTQVASAEPLPSATPAPPPGAEPAVPMAAPSTGTEPIASAGPVNPSDAALGFKPSSAPPLDPSVAQFVPAPIVARYRETAAVAHAASDAPVVAMATPADPQARHARRGVGGPEAMSGAVVANLDAIQQAPAAAATPTAYSSNYGMPAAVVFFPGDGTTLSAAGRARVREAVEAYRAAGGRGFVRVVGHSSSRTANMPVEKHLELIFERSKARADAVARELIHEGIPASKVLTDAVGDSQPVYYESMPSGEDGNRRAEIFLQT